MVVVFFLLWVYLVQGLWKYRHCLRPTHSTSGNSTASILKIVFDLLGKNASSISRKLEKSICSKDVEK